MPAGAAGLLNPDYTRSHNVNDDCGRGLARPGDASEDEDVGGTSATPRHVNEGRHTQVVQRFDGVRPARPRDSRRRPGRRGFSRFWQCAC